MNNWVVISYVNFIMNPNSRILPHLNLCYLQKKAYDAHRKKIDAIKQSLRVSLVKKLGNLEESRSVNDKMCRKDSFNKMTTIKEQGSDSKLSRMKPANRRKYWDQLKENQRLFRRIQSCESTISRRVIERHKLKSMQFKSRISKFKSDPNTSKLLLKSEHSLQVLQKLREKEKLRQILLFPGQETVENYVSTAEIYHKSNSLLSKIASLESPKFRAEINQHIKKGSLGQLIMKRNSRQIQRHFYRENSPFIVPRRFSAFPEDFGPGKQKRVYTQVAEQWRQRCFTTQTKNYH